MDKSSKLYKWEGDTYRVDLDAPSGSRVLIKEGEDFVSKPDLGKLGATILFDGVPLSLENKEVL